MSHCNGQPLIGSCTNAVIQKVLVWWQKQEDITQTPDELGHWGQTAMMWVNGGGEEGKRKNGKQGETTLLDIF